MCSWYMIDSGTKIDIFPFSANHQDADLSEKSNRRHNRENMNIQSENVEMIIPH